MYLPSKLHRLTLTTLALILLISPLVSLVAGEDTSQSTMSPSLELFGAGARWAARNGTSALYVNWKDNWSAHHSTDGGNWVWFGESAMDSWRSSITDALQQSGFQVSHAGDIPESLDNYDLVVLSAYYAVEPRHEPLIRDYIRNGGSVVMWAGAPCYLPAHSKTLSTNTNLTSIQEWFGSSHYTNAGGVVTPAFDNPFGISLQENDVVLRTSGFTFAGVSSLAGTAHAIAFWSSGAIFGGAIFAFTHEYGAGRVYYQAYTDTKIPEEDTPFDDSEIPEEYEPSPAASGIPTSISISTDVPSSFVGFIVTVYGNLNDTFGVAVFGEPVFLYYTFPEYGSWIPVTSDTTDESGGYNINWIPPATGSFTLKAEWKGNATHSGSSDIVSLSIMPYKNEQVFSVESNSTVTGLAFNSTSLKFNFSVSGPDDTKGYVKLIVAKSIVTDVTGVEVLLDGKKMNYSVSSIGDSSWLLLFSYAHSTHDVTISLGVQSEQQDAFLTTLVAAVSGASATVIGLGVMFYFKKRNPQAENDLVKKS
jgi:hypothetical protein